MLPLLFRPARSLYSVGCALPWRQRWLYTSVSRWLNGVAIKMPSLSPTMSEGSIVKWYKSEGERLEPGDILCDIQTDKAVVSLENEEEGVLAKIVRDDSSGEISVGEVIAVYVQSGEDWRQVDVPSAGATVPPDSGAKLTPAPPTAAGGGGRGGNRTSSAIGPAVRHLCDQYQIELERVTATGPQNNVTKGDILAFIEQHQLKPVVFSTSSTSTTSATPAAATGATSQKKSSTSIASASSAPAPPPPPDASSSSSSYVDIPLSAATIELQQRVAATKRRVPHGYVYCDSVGLGALQQLHVQLAPRYDAQLTVDDLMIKCVGLAMMLCPRLRTTTVCDQIARADDTLPLEEQQQQQEQQQQLCANLCWVAVDERKGAPDGVATRVVYDAGSATLEAIRQQRCSARVTDAVVGDVGQTVSDSRQQQQLPPPPPPPPPVVAGTVTSYMACCVRSVTELLLAESQCFALTVGGRRLSVVEPHAPPEPTVSLSLAYDARLVTETEAAEFMQCVTSLIASPRLVENAARPTDLS